MGWDPSVLRKYNTTGHFRLLNQVRSELKGNPLIRPKDGETIGAVNRSKSLIRALDGRPNTGNAFGKPRRQVQPQETLAVIAPLVDPSSDLYEDQGGGNTFRDRLNAIDMR